MRVPYTLKPTQNNPGSNYRPGCSAKPFLPSPFSSSKPGSKEEKLGFVGLLGGPTNPSGANLDKNHDGGKTTTTLRTTRLRFSGIGVHRHPPTPQRDFYYEGLCVRGRGGGERSSTPARFPPPGIDPRASFSAEGDEKAASNPASQGAQRGLHRLIFRRRVLLPRRSF